MEYSQEKFQKHLKEEHKQTLFSEYLREIVYGGNDGIVTTFAVVAGFAGAQSGGDTVITGSFLAVLLFGFANLFADATSMALGNFLSVRSAQDVYRGEQEKERSEIRTSPGMEKAETLHIFQQKGFTREDAEKLTEVITSNEDYWVEFMMRDELEMTNPEGESPYLSGLVTFLSFVFFGFIPLFPYMMMRQDTAVFEWSVISSLIALILLGLLRWKVTKESIYHSVFEVVVLGGISAVIAFVVGSLFV